MEARSYTVSEESVENGYPVRHKRTWTETEHGYMDKTYRDGQLVALSLWGRKDPSFARYIGEEGRKALGLA